jgi:hypothetical protein
MDLAASVLKTAELLLGLALLYFRYCLYESEEGRLQNAAAEFWIRLSEQAHTAKKQFAHLLKETTRLSLTVFDRLFGVRLISFRAVAVSALLATASLCITSAWESTNNPRLVVEAVAVALVFILVSIIPALIRRAWVGWARGLFALAAVLLICFTLGHAIAHKLPNEFVMTIVLIAVLAAPVMDFLWLVSCRLALERAHKQERLALHVRAILVGIYMTYLTMALPVLAKELFLSLGNTTAAHVALTLGLFLYAVALTRLFVSAVSLVQVIILIWALAHWIIWPPLARIVYAAERFQLFRERKLFGAFGSALLFHGLGGANWVLTVLKAAGLPP